MTVLFQTYTATLAGLNSGLVAGIYSGIYLAFDIWQTNDGILSCINSAVILSGLFSGILSGIYSDILSDINSGFPSGIYSCILYPHSIWCGRYSALNSIPLIRELCPFVSKLDRLRNSSMDD